LAEAAPCRLTELRGQPSRIYKVNLRDEKALRGLEAGGPGRPSVTSIAQSGLIR
jgi:hypothetical protein